MAKREEFRRVVVVIPAFNESQSLAGTIKALRDLGSWFNSQGLELKVYVVDDGSVDHTYEIAHKAGADRVLRHSKNIGLGAAVRTGLAKAWQDGASIVVKFDADLQHDPQDIPMLLEPLLNDEADIVYGHRFERIEYRMPILRKIGNRIFTSLMRSLTGWPIRDSQPGIFAVNSVYLSVFRIPGDYNYTQQILLDAYVKGMRFADRDVRFRRRMSGSSFISFRYPFKVVTQILWVVLNTRPMKVFGSVGLFFLVASSGIGLAELFYYFFCISVKPIIHTNLVLALFLIGMQTLFFGILAELIIQSRPK